MPGSKSGGSDRKEARAVDYVKTRQEAEAELERRKAGEKSDKATRPSDAPETDDSPKRHGDKLEKARDMAAGKPKD